MMDTPKTLRTLTEIVMKLQHEILLLKERVRAMETGNGGKRT